MKANKKDWGGTVFAVDPHTGSPEHKKKGKVNTLSQFKKNITKAGVTDVVAPLVMTSEEASKKFKDFEYPRIIERRLTSEQTSILLVFVGLLMVTTLWILVYW